MQRLSVEVRHSERRDRLIWVIESEETYRWRGVEHYRAGGLSDMKSHSLLFESKQALAAKFDRGISSMCCSYRLENQGFSFRRTGVDRQTCHVVVEERFGKRVDSSQDRDLTRIGPLRRERQSRTAR